MVFIPSNSWKDVNQKINSINARIDAGSFYCDNDDGEIVFRIHLLKMNADACALSISIKTASYRLMRYLGDIVSVAEECAEEQEYRIVDREANR